MSQKIINLDNCLKAMKKCLKIPGVENCICFSDAFKVLDGEIIELTKKIGPASDLKVKEKLASIKKEIEKIRGNIFPGNKECLGCNPCLASVVFKTYPDRLNGLYLNGEL